LTNHINMIYNESVMIETIQHIWLPATEAYRPTAHWGDPSEYTCARTQKSVATCTLLRFIALYYMLLLSITLLAASHLAGRGNSGTGTICRAREKSRNRQSKFSTLLFSTLFHPIHPYSPFSLATSPASRAVWYILSRHADIARCLGLPFR
jgi:hypothetical protein